MAISSPDVQRKQGPAPMQLLSQSLQQMTSILNSRKELELARDELVLEETRVRLTHTDRLLAMSIEEHGGIGQAARVDREIS
jgi:hypothetical protein